MPQIGPYSHQNSNISDIEILAKLWGDLIHLREELSESKLTATSSAVEEAITVLNCEISDRLLLKMASNVIKLEDYINHNS
jgi:hypothetical protein